MTFFSPINTTILVNTGARALSSTPSGPDNSFHLRVDQTQLSIPLDRDLDFYSIASGFGQVQIIHGLSLPSEYNFTSYGDGTSFTPPSITSVAISVRAKSDLASTFSLMVERSGAIGFISPTIVTTTSFTQTVLTLLIDPITSQPWRANDLFNSRFGVAISGTRAFDISWLFFEVLEGRAVGGSRARIGPDQGEPSFFCARCSRPFHRSKLFINRDPAHEDFGLLLCPQDADISTRREIEDLKGTSLVEGDIDRELL